MAEEKRRFTVISNTELEQEREEREKHKNKYERARQMSYQTNPLREQFMRFTNEEAGKRFSIEDLLKW
ncbi:hypothetical protein IKQ21_07005 [bacterium]|nr:hypothetical protein [bacterium]